MGAVLDPAGVTARVVVGVRNGTVPRGAHFGQLLGEQEAAVVVDEGAGLGGRSRGGGSGIEAVADVEGVKV